MAKLHELLAVEPQREKDARLIADEAVELFGKPERFQERTSTISYFDEEEAARLNGSETKPMQTTVPAKLEHVRRVVGRYLNVLAAKEMASAEARADIVIGDVTLFEGAPSGLLLTIENRLNILRHVLEAIPTHRPGNEWRRDPDKGEHIYRAHGIAKTFKPRKTLQYKEVSPATDKHPAQVEKWWEDKPIAEIVNEIWSGELTSRQKADILERLSLLTQAVKRAVKRAGQVEAEDKEIAEPIFDYLLAPLKE